MATIEVLKSEKQDSGKVRVSIEARTIDGRYTFFPMEIDDCGSAAGNEDRALGEVHRLVEDLATGLLLRLAWASCLLYSRQRRSHWPSRDAAAPHPCAWKERSACA